MTLLPKTMENSDFRETKQINIIRKVLSAIE